MLILLAEDNESFRWIMKIMLERMGHEVDDVVDGTEALKKNPANYNLLITDIQMTPMHGLDLIESIRDSGITVPILVVSGRQSLASHEVMTRGKGKTSFLYKPFGYDDLKEKIEELC